MSAVTPEIRLLPQPGLRLAEFLPEIAAWRAGVKLVLQHHLRPFVLKVQFSILSVNRFIANCA